MEEGSELAAMGYKQYATIDLTTDFSVSDCGKAMQLQSEMAHARRNYADQITVEGSTPSAATKTKQNPRWE